MTGYTDAIWLVAYNIDGLVVNYGISNTVVFEIP